MISVPPPLALFVFLFSLAFLCHRVKTLNFEDCGTMECAADEGGDEAGPSSCKKPRQNNPISGMISGGERAADNSHHFPWLVYIISEDPDTDASSACVGSIVGHRWILTAKHCINESRIHRIAVGSVHLDGRLEVKRAQQFYKYPIWTSWTLGGIDFDIALLELAESDRLIFSEKVRRICLPQYLPIQNGQRATIAGWGYRWWDGEGNKQIDHPGKTTSQLHYGQIRMATHPYYRMENPALKCSAKVNPWYICGVGDMAELKWTAHGKGDSGGPVIVRRKLSEKVVVHYQAGIVVGSLPPKVNENTIKAFKPTQIKAYMREYLPVDHFCEWIRLITKREVKCEPVRGEEGG